MTYAPYQLNVQAAAAADQPSRIEHSGKYVGHINHIEFIRSTRDTDGVEIDFTDNNGCSTRVTLWTRKPDGTELSGFKTLNALMTCAKLRALTPKQSTIKKWDHDAGAMADVQTHIAAEVNKTPVGLLLQRENYFNANDQERHTMLLYSAFDAQTELMAAEIVGKKTTPESLPKVLTRLMDNPIVWRKQQKSGGAAPVTGGGYAAAGQAHTMAPDFEDDLPF